MIGDQLEFPGLDESRLRALAVEAGQNDLVEQLDRLVERPEQSA
ncbi:hypothetical protein ACH347_43875 [Saccharopolyspora sp. 5N102]